MHPSDGQGDMPPPRACRPAVPERATVFGDALRRDSGALNYSMTAVPGSFNLPSPGMPTIAFENELPPGAMQKSAPRVGAVVLAVPVTVTAPSITPLSVKHSRRLVTHV